MKNNTTIYTVDNKFHNVQWMTLEMAERLKGIFKKYKIKNCLELGFMHGKSSAFIASIFNELNIDGHLTTIDLKWAKDEKPNINEILKELNLTKFVTTYFEQVSHTWRLMKLLEQNPTPYFDFCYIDSGHSWDDTGFGFFLVDKLLKPGGIILFDDLGWKLSDDPPCKKEDLSIWVRSFTEEEANTYQVRKVWELLVKKHPNYHNFKEDGTWGFAQKKL